MMLATLVCLEDVWVPLQGQSFAYFVERIDIVSGGKMGVISEERTETMLLKTQAATEIAQFLVHHPTPEQIVAFHPSPEVAERAYELIQTDRDGELSEAERKELESYLVIEYLMEVIKLEAHRQLKQRAS